MSLSSLPHVEVNTVEEYRSTLKALAKNPELAKEVQTLHLLGAQLDDTNSSTESFIENQNSLDAAFQAVLPSLINLVEFKYVFAQS